MKWHKAKCIMCGKDIPYFNVKDVPKICEQKVCQTNYRYQQKHRDTLTGEVPDVKDIKKW